VKALNQLLSYYSPIKRKNVASAFLLVLLFGWLGAFYVRVRYALLLLMSGIAYLFFVFLATFAWSRLLVSARVSYEEYEYMTQNFGGFLVFIGVVLHIASAFLAGALANRSQQSKNDLQTTERGI